MKANKKDKNEKKSLGREILGWIIYFAVILGMTYFIITFVGQRTTVSGSSMETTLSDGDNLIVDKISFRFREPERFEIIVFPYQHAENTYYIPKNDTSPIKFELKPSAKVGGEQLIQLYLEQFLITLLRDVTEKQEISFLPTKESVETQLVSQIKQYIRSKAAEKVKVEDICNAFGYSKSYLSLLFKEQTGYPLSQYHTRCQIEEAKKMIRQNRFNITQISDLLGFDNPQYFARVFKRVTGLTPTEFRRSLAIDN